jgi:hypothetical protein
MFLILGLGLATGLRREPVSTPFALKGELGAAEAAVKRAPADPLIASKQRAPADLTAPPKGQLTGTVPSKASLNIRCRISLASCRRWIALRERNGRLFVHSAQR